MRAWFLTTTTYGTWLPGDPRGSVTSVRDRRAGDPEILSRIEHDLPGEPYEGDMPGLYLAAVDQLTGRPIYLDLAKAELVLAQFQETARFRNWTLKAVSIMCNHWHMVVFVPEDPDPKKIRSTFKAYASRALNRQHGTPPSETWWTQRGSTRKLKDDAAIAAASNYVLYKQPNPLIVWSLEHGRII